MPVKIGIDIGSSTTKIVAFEGEHMLPPMAVKADSQVASLYGAFGRYLYENNLELADVEGGGGGHLNASGGEFYGTMDEARKVFEQALEKYKPLLNAKG